MTKIYRKYKDYHKTENNITYKKCQDCMDWFEMNLINFGKDKGTKDGFNVRCKECQRIYQEQYYLDTRDHQLEKSKIYQRKHWDEQSKRFKKWYRENKEYMTEINDKWLEENKEKKKIYLRWYRRLFKDKINSYSKNKRKHDVTTKEWEACKKYFIHRCCYCGLAIEEHYFTRMGVTKLGDFHKEHACDQGRNDIKNLLPSCGDCNSAKHAKAFHDFYNPSNANYTIERYLRIVQWLRYDCLKYAEPKDKKMRSKITKLKASRNKQNIKVRYI